MNREESLLNIRPILELETEHTSNTEKFQNEVLRPILKFQNKALLRLYRHYITVYKKVFLKLDNIKKMEYIKHSLTKDQKLKNVMIGIIIGQMTDDELNQYFMNEKEYNRRISQMIIKRLQDQIMILSSI